MNIFYKNKLKQIFWFQKNGFFIIFFGIISVLNIFLRGKIGFFDYDSVKNYTILQEFQHNNFQHIFHHASPLFYLYMYAGNFIFSIEMLMIFTHTWAMCVWLMFLKKYFFEKKENIFFVYILYFMGAFILVFSHFLWVSGAYFGMESLSLVISGYLFSFYLKTFLSNKNEFYFKNLQITAFLFGLLYTLNYKAIMLLPIFLLLECFQRVRFFSFKKCFFCIIISSLPLLFLMILGVFLGVSFLQYPRIIAFTFLMSSGQKVAFGSQFLGFNTFYFYWFLIYEHLLMFLIAFLLLFNFCIYLFYIHQKKYFQAIKNTFSTIQNIPFWFFICYFFFVFLFLMSFFPTAPRGLVFVYPFIFFFCFYILKKIFVFIYENNTIQSIKISFFFKSFFSIFVCFLFLYLILIFNFNSQIISYYLPTKNTYPEIAKYIHDQKITHIATSQSLQILPYAQKYGIKVYPINHQKDIKNASQQITHFLLDDYCEVLNTKNHFLDWQNIPSNQIIKTWKLPSLNKPLLFFEHTEFTKLSFDSTQKKLEKANKLTLKLLKRIEIKE